MSVIVKGMEMPNKCCECNIRYEMFCPLLHRFIADEGRRHNCPLGEVPEQHGRLGDLDAVAKQIDYIANLDWNKQVGASGGMLAALEVVEDAPTIIPAEEVSGNSGELED